MKLWGIGDANAAISMPLRVPESQLLWFMPGQLFWV
jgi:hypothetical protein